MTGPEHYAKAEELLGVIGDGMYGGSPEVSATVAAAAQAHATLALVAAVANRDAGDALVDASSGNPAVVGPSWGEVLKP